MAEATFPAQRFREAGASTHEIEQLEAEFGRSDVSAQTALASAFAQQSTNFFREHLADLRRAGHFETPAVLLGTTSSETVDESDADDEPSQASSEAPQAPQDAPPPDAPE